MRKDYRPVYHLSVEKGWSNDPNGLIYFNGRYHMFFQHYPHEPQWGTMHWGHAVTDDFVKWEHLPVALVPDQDYEVICGCCSGSAIEKDGKMVLMYTAAQPTLQRQCLAVSEDGINFEKNSDNPVLTADMLDEEVSPLDFRDPKVFEKDGRYYMVAGVRILKKGMNPKSTSFSALNVTKDLPDVGDPVKSPSVLDVSQSDPDNEGLGNMILCTSTDLVNWEYIGKMIIPGDGIEKGYFRLNGVYECPDYFELDGTEVLLSSPQNLEAMGPLYQNIHSALYMTGRLDFESGRFEIEDASEIDRGFDFYASQTMLTPDGRRIMVAWKEMWDRNYPTQDEGWAGTYVLPRELEIRDGRLFQHPVSEIENYRTEKVSHKSLLAENEEFEVDGIEGESIELSFTMDTEDSETCGVRVFFGKEHETLIYYDRKRECLVFNRENSGIILTGREINTKERICPVKPGKINLRIFLDVCSIEVFINGGENVMTGNVYPDQEDTGIRFFSTGGSALFTDIVKYEIR